MKFSMEVMKEASMEVASTEMAAAVVEVLNTARGSFHCFREITSGSGFNERTSDASVEEVEASVGAVGKLPRKSVIKANNVGDRNCDRSLDGHMLDEGVGGGADETISGK